MVDIFASCAVMAADELGSSCCVGKDGEGWVFGVEAITAGCAAAGMLPKACPSISIGMTRWVSGGGMDAVVAWCC